jgi:hypothetical protein
MASNNEKSDHERDSAFGLPDSFFESIKPGFQSVGKPSKALPKGHDRFPRMATDKDVPREPLAKRIAGKK